MEVNHIAVVGAGTMGAGIAQVAAQHGCRVDLIDVNEDILNRAEERIRAFLRRSVEKGKMSSDDRDALLERIVFRDAIADIAGVQLAVEAVVENLEIKRLVFQSLEAKTSEDAVLATNTSSLRVNDIATAVKKPERVVGMHFFNPAPLMPLVEIIATPSSDRAAVTLAADATRCWGKTPVQAKDTPGFIVNRVARGYYLESLRMIGEGIARVDQIDGAMKSMGRFRMGPFELMDLVGLDVNYAVSQSVWEQSGRPERLTPHDIQKSLVDAGRLGRKTDAGFYRYDSETPSVDVTFPATELRLNSATEVCVKSFCERAIAPDAAAGTEVSIVDCYVFARVLVTVMNEAALTLADGVATADDIDIAMQKGTNYPEGPLAWAGRVGHRLVGEWLTALGRQTASVRFNSAPLFQ